MSPDTDVPEYADPLSQLHAELELLKNLNDVTRLVAENDPLGGTLERVCELAARTLTGCEVGMSLGGQARRLESAANSTERSAFLDRSQRDLGEGPCLTALSTQVRVRAGYEEMAGRWPSFARVALDHGVVEVVAEPFVVMGEASGALNVYTFEPGALTGRHLRLVTLLAAQATTALANARLYARSAELVRNLQVAMESRGVIEQAKGVLMSLHRHDDEEAFELMRRVSQYHNVKVRDLARQVVDWAAGPGHGPTAPSVPAPLEEVLRPAAGPTTV